MLRWEIGLQLYCLCDVCGLGACSCIQTVAVQMCSALCVRYFALCLVVLWNLVVVGFPLANNTLLSSVFSLGLLLPYLFLWQLLSSCFYCFLNVLCCRSALFWGCCCCDCLTCLPGRCSYCCCCCSIISSSFCVQISATSLSIYIWEWWSQRVARVSIPCSFYMRHCIFHVLFLIFFAYGSELVGSWIFNWLKGSHLLVSTDDYATERWRSIAEQICPH